MIQQFEFRTTSIKGLTRIKPFVAPDERGCFLKDYSREVFTQNGIDHDLDEVFYTCSYKGVIRAIHFQREKQQAKLVRCVLGKIYDAVVDLREGSPTFGKWEAFMLSGDNQDALYIPGGCGHGYLVLESAVVSYKCEERFYGEYDDGIVWNAPDIAVGWPLDEIGAPILSKKDRSLQTLRQFTEKYGGLK